MVIVAVSLFQFSAEKKIIALYTTHLHAPQQISHKPSKKLVPGARGMKFCCTGVYSLKWMGRGRDSFVTCTLL